MKTCGHCGLRKPLSDFANATASWCRQCRADEERERRKQPDVVAKYRKRYQEDLYFRAKVLVGAVKKRCKREGYEFDLDPHWLARKIKGVCELTGLPFDLTGERRLYTPSIDRIVAGAGYTKENCRVVLLGVNIALQDWGLEEFLTVAAVLVERHRK